MPKRYKLDESVNKKFEEAFLAEDHTHVYTPGMSSVPGKHRVEKEEILNKVNSFLSTVSKRQYLNPYNCIQRTRLHLNTMGLDFPEFIMSGSVGKIELKLTQFGGRYGYLKTDGQVKSDDGISHRIPGGLVICWYWTVNKGNYFLDAEIKRGELNPIPVSEDGDPAGEQNVHPRQGTSTVADPTANVETPLEEDDLSSEPLSPGPHSDPINKNEKKFVGKQTNNGEKTFHPTQGTSKIKDDLNKIDGSTTPPVTSNAGS